MWGLRPTWISHPLVHSPEGHKSKEPAASFRSAVWMVGVQKIGQYSAFSRPLARRWIGSRMAGAQIVGGPYVSLVALPTPAQGWHFC